MLPSRDLLLCDFFKPACVAFFENGFSSFEFFTERKCSPRVSGIRRCLESGLGFGRQRKQSGPLLIDALGKGKRIRGFLNSLEHLNFLLVRLGAFQDALKSCARLVVTADNTGPPMDFPEKFH